jgi:hypothetical protein
MSLRQSAALLGLLSAAHWSSAEARDRGAWFHSLRMPGTDISCCGIGDCHRTDSDWREGQWWALVEGSWQPIPKERVLKTPSSVDGSAYVCTGSPTMPIPGKPRILPPIYCFVPPSRLM